MWPGAEHPPERRTMKEKILEELKAIAFAKATDYVSVTGEQLTVADTGALAPEAGAAIASIERTSIPP